MDFVDNHKGKTDKETRGAKHQHSVKHCHKVGFQENKDRSR